MKARISKWGNSLALRIPVPIADALGLREGSTVNLERTKDSLVVSRPSYSLDSLLATYDEREKEYDWGEPRGREIW